MSVLYENIDGIALSCYSDSSIGGDAVRAKDVLQAILKERGVKQKELAERMGIKPQNLSKALSNDALKTNDFFNAIDLLGLTISFHDKITGEEVKDKERKPGVLPRVSMVVNGIRYDTEKADALCHTEEINGWMMELYKDFRGRYFVVHWTELDNVNPFISPYAESHAQRLYEAHRGIDDEHPDDAFKNANG